jgi:ABC-type transporter Mla subunit MlaD
MTTTERQLLERLRDEADRAVACLTGQRDYINAALMRASAAASEARRMLGMPEPK